MSADETFGLTDEEHAEIFERISGDSDFACDLARSILALKQERDWLLDQLAHYMPYRRLYMQSLNQGIAHSQEMIGTVFQAVLDPNSVINEGMRAIKQKRAKEAA
jgi:hypothetical protein